MATLLSQPEMQTCQGTADIERAGSINETAQEPIRHDVSHIEDQSSRLPLSRLVLVCASLIMAIFLTCLEQTSVSTALQTIGSALGSEESRAWIGTSFLIGNTASQTIFGRLSDIYGRKPMHLWGLGIFFIGSLLCGFSKSMAQLIAFRGIAGVGGGGVLVCVMAIMSDLVSLKNRGKLQGVIGIGTIVANGIGPTFGGLFAEHGWRWIFWVVCPPTALAFIQCWAWLPLKPIKGSKVKQLQQVDFLGSLCQLGAVIFLLIPISGGGNSFAWNSAESISFLTLGVVFLAAFILIEAKYAKLPIVPLRVFKIPSVFLLCLATFCTGAYFFSAAYYLPVYFQNIRNQSPLLSSAYLQSLILTQVVVIVATGFFLAWLGRYNPILWAGYGIYLIGAGLETRFVASSSNGYVIGILILEGFGMGLTLQTSLVALQALVPHEDRAVITSIRNTARFIGGAFGLAICSGMWNSSNSGSAGTTAQILDETQREMQQAGFDKIWWFLFAIGAAVFLVSLLVKDVGLERPSKGGMKAGREILIAAEGQGAIEMRGIASEDAVRGSKSVGEA